MDTGSDNKQSSTEFQQTADYHNAASTTASRDPDNVTPIANQQIDTPKKKRVIWLFVLIGIVLITIGIITSYLFIKDNADKAADNYTTSLKTYITQLYNRVNSPTGSPEDVKDFLLKLKRPQLASTFYSVVSSKYTAAQTLAIESKNKLIPFDEQMASFVTVYNYQQVSRDLVVKAGSAYQPTSDNSKYLSNSLNIMKQVKALADKIQVSSELKLGFAGISKRSEDMITAFTAMITAHNAGDQIAFKAADVKFMAISNAEAAIEKELFADYYDGLLSKFVESTKGLKEYANTIPTS